MSLFSSFRAQMVFFVAAMVLLTTITLQILNLQLERRITVAAEEQFNEVNRAIDLAVNSFPSKEYLYQITRDNQMAFSPDSTVQNIFIVSKEGSVINSTNADDMEKPLRPEIASLPPIRHNEATAHNTYNTSKIEFPVETESGTRKVLLVISLQRLSNAVSDVGQIRLYATIALGLILLSITSFSL